jgi:hypothetical protein
MDKRGVDVEPRFGPLLSTIGPYASRCGATVAATELQPVDDMVMSANFNLRFRIRFGVFVSQRFVRLSYPLPLSPTRYGTEAAS